MELLRNRNIFLLKILSSQLANHEELVVLTLLNLFHRLFKNIVVVCSRKTFISRNNNEALYTVFRCFIRSDIHILVLDIRQMPYNTGYHVAQSVKVRLRLFKTLLGLAQLRGGYHVHSVSDFHGVLNTFHSALNFTCICHDLSLLSHIFIPEGLGSINDCLVKLLI